MAWSAKPGRTLRYALLLCLLAAALIILLRISRTRASQASSPAVNPVSLSETRNMLGTYLTLTVVDEKLYSPAPAPPSQAPRRSRSRSSRAPVSTRWKAIAAPATASTTSR